MPQCWMKAFLTRSKRAPLKIRIEGACFRDFQNIVEKVMDHVDRIQELSLEFLDAPKFSFDRAPHLRYLKISVNRSRSYRNSSVLFNGDTPALRTLDVSGCAVIWGSLNPSGLTTLSLNTSQQNTKEFLAILSHMQELTRLYLTLFLSGSRTFISSAAFNTFQKISLPHLSRLGIVAPFSTVITLLFCVDIPLNTQVKLECRYCSDDPSFPEDDTLLSSALAQKFSVSGDQALSSPIIHSFVVQFTHWGPKLTFSASKHDFDACISKPDMQLSPDTLCHSGWDCNVPLQILLHQALIHEDRTMNNICYAISLTHVQSAHFVRPPVAYAFWKRILAHLPDLRHLKLSNSEMPELASVLSLSPTSDGHSDEGPNQIFAPALEELELSRIEFAPEPTECDMDMLGTDLGSLEDALSTREDPRVCLTLTRCVQREPEVDEYYSETEDSD